MKDGFHIELNSKDQSDEDYKKMTIDALNERIKDKDEIIKLLKCENERLKANKEENHRIESNR
jgi:hypothetical protein